MTKSKLKRSNDGQTALTLKMAAAVMVVFMAATMAAANPWNIGHESNDGGAASVTATLLDGVLTISGTGKMMDWELDNGVFPPWFDDQLDDITSVVIEDGVESIGDGAFYGRESLKSVVIGDAVKSIGYAAFEVCISLKTVVIGDGVESIGDIAFRLCSSLESVVIPDAVKSIGYAAFQECSSLESVVIGEGVESIGDFAFGLCSSLETITSLNPTPPTLLGDDVFYEVPMTVVLNAPSCVYERADGWKDFANINALHDESGDEATCTREGCMIPKTGTVWEIGYPTASDITATLSNGVMTVRGTGKMMDWEYQGMPWFNNLDNITSVVIEDGVESIGDDAFAECHSLESVLIGKDVESIGFAAFAMCISLETVVIPDAVKSIGDGAFVFCSSLKSVVIGKSVESIGDFAFAYCISLETITSLNPTPPTLGDDVFYEVPMTVVLNAPSCVYERADGWKDFTNINALHDMVAFNKLNATCIAAGHQAGEKCSRCPNKTGGEEITILTHAYTDTGALKTAATCQSPAIHKGKCVNGCNLDSETVTVSVGTLDANAHAWVSSGENTRTCTICGETETTSSISTNDRIIRDDIVIPPEEAIIVTPSAIVSDGFVVGPNVVNKNLGAGMINIYRLGGRVDKGTLTIYNSRGNVVNKLSLSESYGMNYNVDADDSGMNPNKRIVGTWDLRDNKKRLVSDGTYLLRGTITVNGKKEKVSLLVNVR